MTATRGTITELLTSAAVVLMAAVSTPAEVSAQQARCMSSTALPAQADFLCALGETSFATGDFEWAAELLEQALRIQDDPVVRERAALARSYAGRSEPVRRARATQAPVPLSSVSLSVSLTEGPPPAQTAPDDPLASVVWVLLGVTAALAAALGAVAIAVSDE
ncbi:MAG: tetratricopeptide repeat protein [Sandaracinaceae bacterium]